MQSKAANRQQSKQQIDINKKERKRLLEFISNQKQQIEHGFEKQKLGFEKRKHEFKKQNHEFDKKKHEFKNHNDENEIQKKREVIKRQR